MTARVIQFGGWLANRYPAARQAYELARRHYRYVCDTFDPLSTEGVERFHAALERRDEAFERYIQEMHAQ
jgi:hypothetical protein